MADGALRGYNENDIRSIEISGPISITRGETAASRVVTVGSAQSRYDQQEPTDEDLAAATERLGTAGFDLAKAKKEIISVQHLVSRVKVKHKGILEEQAEVIVQTKQALRRMGRWTQVQDILSDMEDEDTDTADKAKVKEAITSSLKRETATVHRLQTAAREKAAEAVHTREFIQSMEGEPSPPICSICYDAPVREVAACGHCFCSDCMSKMLGCYICKRVSGHAIRTLYFT